MNIEKSRMYFIYYWWNYYDQGEITMIKCFDSSAELMQIKN